MEGEQSDDKTNKEEEEPKTFSLLYGLGEDKSRLEETKI